MTITTKSKPNISQYQMLSDPLTRVKPTQYFGVTVNSRLIWSDHIHNVTVKAGKALGYAKYTLNVCTAQVKETAYTMLV